MRPHTQAVIFRRPLTRRHVIEVASQLLLGERDVPIPQPQVVSREKPAQVEVAGPIAEPPTHLHQRVIHSRGAKKVAH